MPSIENPAMQLSCSGPGRIVDILHFGAGDENRTRNLSLARICVTTSTTPATNLAPQGGIEPPTNGLTVRYSTAELLGNTSIIMFFYFMSNELNNGPNHA